MTKHVRKPLPIAKRPALGRALRKRYEEDGISMAQLARRYNVSLSTMQRWFNVFGIKGRHAREAAAVRFGKELAPVKPAIVLEGWAEDGMPILRDPETGDPIRVVDPTGNELEMP